MSLKLAASNIGWESRYDNRVLQTMANLGYAGLEIAPTRLYVSEPYKKVEEFKCYSKTVYRDYGLVVCSMQSIWRGKNESIFDRKGAAALLSYTNEACIFAEQGGIRNLVFGCPRNRNVPRERDYHDADVFIEACGRTAAEHGAIFSIEANPSIYGTNFLNSTKDALDYLESLESIIGLGINLDTGAMIASNESEDIIARALPYISHVHISEPGLKPIKERRFHATLKEILVSGNYTGYVSLEMASQNITVVDECLQYVAETFSD